MSSVADIQNAAFETKMQQLDEEQAIADENLQNDLNREGINEAYKEQLQKEADKKTKEREKEKKKIQLEQAKFEKNKAIFDAIINTATAVIKAAPVVPLMVLSAAVGAGKQIGRAHV